MWSEWGEWSKCSVTCGETASAGTRERNRHVLIEAQHGGIPCEADRPKEVEECIHCTVAPGREEAELRSKTEEEHKKNCIPNCPGNHLSFFRLENCRLIFYSKSKCSNTNDND